MPLLFSHPVKTQPSFLPSMRSRASLRHIRTQKPSPHFLSSLLPPGFRLRLWTQKGHFRLLVCKTEVPRAPHAPRPHRLGWLPSTGHAPERAPTAGEGAASPGSGTAQHCPPSGSSSGRVGARELQLMLRGARQYGCAPVPGADTGCARGE